MNSGVALFLLILILLALGIGLYAFLCDAVGNNHAKTKATLIIIGTVLVAVCGCYLELQDRHTPEALTISTPVTTNKPQMVTAVNELIPIPQSKKHLSTKIEMQNNTLLVTIHVPHGYLKTNLHVLASDGSKINPVVELMEIQPHPANGTYTSRTVWVPINLTGYPGYTKVTPIEFCVIHERKEDE